jgi:bacteriocin-like protein
MRPEDLSPELLELAREAGIDVKELSKELTDAELEAVVGGKGGGGGHHHHP